MLIVVEGCDGVGKSTFVERLRTTLESEDPGRSVRVIHKSKPTRPIFEEYESDLEYFPRTEHVICDRWHWGEPIYGPLYRNEDKLGAAGLVHVDKFLQARGAVMVHLTQSASVVRERAFKERGEDFLQENDVSNVLSWYAELARISLMHVHTLVDPTDVQVKSVLLEGYMQERVALALWKFRTYVGPLNPRYLLLGERRNDPSYDAAFVPYPSTSGRFLLESLPRGIARDCGIANACEEDLPRLYETLGRPRVVALGNAAAKEARWSIGPVPTVPHPQYVRRFHHKRKTEYGEAIGRALMGEETPWQT